MSYSYNRIKELKKDEIFWTKTKKFKVVVEPVERFAKTISKNQLVWVATDEDGLEEEFLITETLEHYGPSIYAYKAYTDIDEEFSITTVGC